MSRDAWWLRWATSSVGSSRLRRTRHGIKWDRHPVGRVINQTSTRDLARRRGTAL